MTALTFRHLRRHWRLNAAVLFCLTLASALLASTASYARVVATQELYQTLEEARPAGRTLLITGSRYAFNDELYQHLQEILGEALKDRLVIRHARSPADPQPAIEGESGTQPISSLDLYSFNMLPDNVRVVAGRLPAQVRLYEATDSWRPPPIEAVIGLRAAEQSGFGVGDRLTGSKTYHRLDIVGIVEPVNPHDDLWGEDLGAFEINTGTPGLGADGIALPLIIAPSSMRSNYPERPIFLHEVRWRINLNTHLIDVERVEALHSDLINFQTQSATRHATTDTGLVQVLADYLAQMSRVRTMLYLLAAQAAIFVMYTLATFTSSIATRTQVELAMLSGRGASVWQITQLFAAENLILALLAALILGPGLAQCAIHLWGMSWGEFGPGTLPGEAWLLSGLTAGLGWLALVYPAFSSARRSPAVGQARRARPPQLSTIQRHYLDLYLLLFGGLLTWQLNQAGSFLMRRVGVSRLADPLLLVGPSLMLVATALVSLRILPFLLRPVDQLFQRSRGVVLPLSLSRLARDPLPPGRLLLLVSLTAGLVLFTRAFGETVAFSQEAAAIYLTGADLRISLDQTGDLPVDLLSSRDAVRAASTVFRGLVQSEDGEPIQLLALDPDSFAQVTHYTARRTDLSVTDIMRVLHAESDGSLPAVFSTAALPPGINAGDRLFLSFAERRLPLRIGATIAAFPTLPGPFVIVSLPHLEEQVGPGLLGSLGSTEAWLAVDPLQHERLVEDPSLKERILDNLQEQLRAIRSDALARGTTDALQLNAMTLVLFSVTVFCLVHWLSALGRRQEFGILRTMGLSKYRTLALLGIEGSLVIFLGLVAGTAIGVGLSQMVIPYSLEALAESLGGVALEGIVVDWAAVARSYILLLLVYGSALLLTLALMRGQAHWVFRTGDE